MEWHDAMQELTPMPAEAAKADLATPTPSVRVKALVWHKQSYKSPDQIGHHASGYSIYESPTSGKCVVSSGSPVFFGPEYTDTLEAAKAAAQADYEARIMSALEPATPLDDPRVLAVVEATKNLTDIAHKHTFGKTGILDVHAAVKNTRAAISALEEEDQ